MGLNFKDGKKKSEFRWKEGNLFFIISVLKIPQCS